MYIESDSNEIKMLDEFVVELSDSNISDNVERSIFYPKLKQLMFKEINLFCREQIALKNDLQFVRMQIGMPMGEQEVRELFETLMKKYNTSNNDNVGLIYHLETTRFDYGVSLFVIIKRDEIYAKKFVFRFRRKEMANPGISFKNETAIPKENVLMDFLKSRRGD